jgi:hypothetical protein
MSHRMKKRRWTAPGLLLLSLGVIAAVVVGVILATRHHTPPVVPVPIPGGAGSPGTAAWGVDAYSAPAGSIPRLELEMGHRFGAFSVYEGLDAASQYPNTAAHEAMSRGALIYLNINSSRRAGSSKQPFCWSDIAAGKDDSMIDAWARAILATNYQRMVLTFEHEPNVNNAHQPKCSSDTPAGYRAAFHHFVGRMRADGVRFPFAFVPTASTYRTGVVDKYAPRSSDYQVIGADAYNRVPQGQHHYHTAAQVLMPMYQWAAANAPGKPVLIGEIGDTQKDPLSARWIADAIGLVRSKGNLLAINWNVTTFSKAPYSPLLKPQALATWVEGARLAFFRPSSPTPTVS